MIWRRMSTHWKAYEVYFPTQQVSRHFDFPIRIYGWIIEDCSECQESHRNGHFTEDCAEAQETRGNWRPSREWFTCWPSIFQRGDFSSYLSRRVVPSINIPYVYSEKNFWSFDKPIWYSSWFADVCLTPLFLRVLLGLVRKISLKSPTSCSMVASSAVPFCVD